MSYPVSMNMTFGNAFLFSPGNSLFTFPQIVNKNKVEPYIQQSKLNLSYKICFAQKVFFVYLVK